MALGASEFDVPLFSQITDKLWTGCSPAEFPDEHESVEYDYTRSMFIRHARPVNCHWLWDLDGPRFDAILDLYGESYIVPSDTDYLAMIMYDSADKLPSEMIEKAVDQVLEWLHADKTVLIHCQAGLNRSALVAARVLMRDTDTEMSAADAIVLIREKRSPMCLCNRHFERFLRELDEPVLLG